MLGTNRDLDLPAGADAGGNEGGPGTLLPLTGVLGVPAFFIDSFGMPPFLLPIFQAAGIEYGVPWEVLAGINEVETDYGRNLAVSSAGAVGWMQFLPSTFALYGVDGNGDGRADPYNPVDAIFSAARYLRAAGADNDLGAAIFAYNHSPSYVTSVLSRARLLGGMPADLVAGLSGLAQGRPPVLGAVAALDDGSTPATRATTLRLRTNPRAAVVAVTDGVIVRIGHSSRLGRYVRLRDVFGNTYTYGGLGSTARRYPVLVGDARLALQSTPPGALTQDAPPTMPATAGAQRAGASSPADRGAGLRRSASRAVAPLASRPVVVPWQDVSPALASTNWKAQAQRTSRATAKAKAAPADALTSYDRRLLGGVAPRDVRYRPLRTGSRVIAGTIIAHAGAADATSGGLAFEIRPAGRGAPRIQPRPVVAGWKLLQSAARSASPLGDAGQADIGRVLLLGKRELQREVLDDGRIVIYPCGREDIRAGRIDRRILATLKFLAMSGLDPTVSSLQCGHGLLSSSGEVSEHSTGAAVDIAAVNGVPLVGHQGPGSLAETAIRRLLLLQGTLRPHQIISLYAVDGADNTLAMADHADHIHVGFAANGTDTRLAAGSSDGIMPASAWRRLSRRLGTIANPTVRTTPSHDARTAPRRP